jgi:uncharacterized RDD family membrane protein YckC
MTSEAQNLTVNTRPVFWKRLVALLIDTILLGLVGLALGFLFERQFVEIGDLGRLIGFGIALIYFGLLNSVIGAGQTLGKRVMNIRVVNSENQTINIVKSSIRYSILSIPFFINGLELPSGAFNSIFVYLLSFILFGGLFSIFYLFIFNRKTRQSLHDLVVNTYVVDKNQSEYERGPVWKVHLYIVVGFYLLALVGPFVTLKLINEESFNQMLDAQDNLMIHENIRHASLTVGESFTATVKTGKNSTTYISADVFLIKDLVGDSELAREIAISIKENYPESTDKDILQVTLIYGYNIGIASKWKNFSHQFDPKEL